MNMKKIFCMLMIFCFVFGLYSVSFSQAVKKDINKATVEELVTVKGIAEKKAQAILDFVKEKAASKQWMSFLE